MKILLISGSPRDGNSESMLRKLNSLLKESELILLRKHNILKCEGCVEICNKSLECKHDDDTALLLDKFEKADAIVMASPTYFSMPSGLLKNFIDKCSVLWNKKCEGKFDASNKKGAVITVGTHMPSVEKTAKCLEEFFRIFGIKIVKTITVQGVSEIPEKDHVLKDSELIEELEDLAKKLS